MKRTIPVIVLEHGAPLFYQSHYQYYRRQIGAADLKLLWGPHNLEMMESYGCSADKLKVTGYPRFDELPECKAVKKREGSRPRILFLGTWKIAGKMHRIFESAAEECDRQGYDLVYKPHPSEYRSEFSLLSRCKSLGISVIENENLFEEVAAADVVLTSPTSVLIPIYFFYKPFFSYYPVLMGKFTKGLLKLYHEFPMPRFSLLRQTANIRKLLDMKIDKSLYDNAFDRLAYRRDGGNTERVYRTCMEMTGR